MQTSGNRRFALMISVGSFFCLHGSCLVAATEDSGAVIYVNKYFEAREHDASTKYVFNGDTRLARITGSLSTRTRVQRLRLFRGWNLCSLAVTASNCLEQLSASSSAIAAAYRWVSQNNNFVSVSSGETLTAGTVLWIKSITNLNAIVTGNYSEPENVHVPAGPTFVSSAGLEVWSISNNAPQMLLVQKYDPQSRDWKIGFGDLLQRSSNLPGFVAPGEALFVLMNGPAVLNIPTPAARVHYYHYDHLDSSTVVSDVNANVVEENTFYPFGQQRGSNRPQTQPEKYRFTQMERDAETGLDCYPARYCDSLLGRFLKPDTLSRNLETAGHAGLLNPQKMNPYSYVRNNPLKYTDPTGLEETQPAKESPPAQPASSSKPLNLSLPPNYVPPQSTQPPSVAAAKAPAAPIGTTVTVPAPQPGAMDRAQAAWDESKGQPSPAPKQGSAGDVISAVGKVQVNGQSLQDRATGALIQPVQTDWAKATPGEKATVIASGVVMAGIAAPALQNKDARAALQTVVPKVEFAVPLGKDLKLGVSVSTTKPEAGLTLGGRF